MAQANVKLTVDATSATRALSNVQRSTNTLQKSFGGLKTAIAGIGLTVLARNAVKTAANFNTSKIEQPLQVGGSMDTASPNGQLPEGNVSMDQIMGLMNSKG